MTTKTVKLMEAKHSEVMAAYHKGDNKFKETLEGLFGSEEFNKPITEMVKTFDDALQITGQDWCTPEGLTRDEIAYRKLKIIAQALNQGWEPDWTDRDQCKYYPWFNNYKSGVGFSYLICDDDYSGTSVGSRLCYQSAELAEYAGKQFIDIYNQYLTKH